MSLSGKKQPDVAAAIAAYERACRIDPHTCADFGDAMWQGKLGDADLARGTGLHARACADGHAWSCFAVALATIIGKGVKADEARARTLIADACARGVDDACAFDGQRAKCDKGDLDACHEVGQAWELAAEAVEQAEAAYGKACAGGAAKSCNEAGSMFTLVDDTAKAIVYYRKGCELKHAESCNDLAVYVTDEKEEADAHKRACELDKKYCAP
jgi:TPR repeat protein